MTRSNQKFAFYSFDGSQWAGVLRLGLAEKGYKEGIDYTITDVDLFTAANFDPEYLAINPNGTVPSLTSPSLINPLTDSVEILQYLDETRGKSLVPKSVTAQHRMQEIVHLVHSGEVDTNLILLQARDQEEMESKQSSMWAGFLSARQAKLDKERAAHPEHSFYGPKAAENSAVHELYQTNVAGDSHEAFFQLTHDMYRKFASGMDKLDSLLILPYAVGGEISEADLHMVPWLSHAMWGAGTPPAEIHNFGTLEALVQKSVPDFKVRPKVRKWWSNITERESFKEVFSELH